MLLFLQKVILTLSEVQMEQAINRINEFQRETIEKADKIEGSKEYVANQSIVNT